MNKLFIYFQTVLFALLPLGLQAMQPKQFIPLTQYLSIHTQGKHARNSTTLTLFPQKTWLKAEEREAFLTQSPAKLKAFLEGGNTAALWVVDENGDTPLTTACWRNWKNTIEVILEHLIDQESKGSITKEDIVKYVNKTGEEDRTPLMCLAAQCGHTGYSVINLTPEKSYVLIQSLIDLGADAHAQMTTDNCTFLNKGETIFTRCKEGDLKNILKYQPDNDYTKFLKTLPKVTTPVLIYPQQIINAPSFTWYATGAAAVGVIGYVVYRCFFTQEEQLENDDLTIDNVQE